MSAAGSPGGLARILVVLVLGAVNVLGAACQSKSARPTTTATCDVQTATTSASGALLTAAALLSATVVVEAGSNPSPRCFHLTTGATLTLHPGDRAWFVANRAPDLSPAGAVSVSTAPGPSGTAPGPGGFLTSHVIVTLTATRPATVAVRWVDCSGTEC